ncbi:spondin-1 [Tribolium madens]|uniref:spondin-1 n=1 Tax=Tribolium madens TaxID=41895 RepID=UPI001CF748DE|nr:spondin-1 [Tribolium madens]
MLKPLLILLFYFVCFVWCCIREPSIYHSKVPKLPGDNGFQIRINENPEKYIPGKVYTLYLMGLKTHNKLQHFKRFTINVEATNEPGNLSPQRVGSFQLFSDSISKFNEECVNTISESNDSPKTEAFFMWAAPPPGSGCVTFKAMVLQDSTHWYADEGNLTKTFCEQTEKDIKLDENDCCACDEAKYSMIFEGIWSNKTHPKDFPFSLWLTHFSDVIGASHEKNFSFWGEGQIASEGFRSLAEWGSVRLLETELRAKSKYLRTIIKAAGLWYPNVNTNTSANFRVDRRHHLISLSSMLGPSPDWVVGVNGLNLCLKNCTWIEDLIIDLFPYDAGTDSGVSYMSPNAETKPRERMYRITTTYPEDPRAPFYDPSKKEMTPLARLYLKREKLIPKNCDENFLNAQLDFSENTEEVNRPECAVTEYNEWSECSVTCGKGLRMRSREYRMPQKAKMFNCNRQLISKEMCVATVPECDGGTPDEEEESIDDIPLENNEGFCATSPWGPWSECSATCGVGFKMRTRLFIDRMGRKKCPHVTVVEKEKCMGPPCTAEQIEIPDPMCPTTDWSDWSPCSASCGKGVKMRTRLLLVEPGLQQKCSSRVELVQQAPCMDTPDCTIDMATAKVICMQESEPGPCTGYFNRWYFEPRKMMCVPFIYGGCRGNRNNFLTAQECMEACQVVRDALKGNINNENVNSNPSAVASSSGNNDRFVDCMVSEWSPWSQCSVTCGIGISEKFRMVKRPAENGGRPCPSRLVKKRRCRGPPCV